MKRSRWKSAARSPVVHVPKDCDLDQAEQAYVRLLELFQELEHKRADLVQRLGVLAAKITVLKAIRTGSLEVVGAK